MGANISRRLHPCKVEFLHNESFDLIISRQIFVYVGDKSLSIARAHVSKHPFSVFPASCPNHPKKSKCFCHLMNFLRSRA